MGLFGNDRSETARCSAHAGDIKNVEALSVEPQTRQRPLYEAILDGRRLAPMTRVEEWADQPEVPRTPFVARLRRGRQHRYVDRFVRPARADPIGPDRQHRTRG